jgi:hypothetical protein
MFLYFQSDPSHQIILRLKSYEAIRQGLQCQFDACEHTLTECLTLGFEKYVSQMKEKLYNSVDHLLFHLNM